MSVLPKEVSRVNTITIKISMEFFAEIENPILKFIWNLKGPQIARRILEKNKNKTEGLTLRDFKLTIKPY